MSKKDIRKPMVSLVALEALVEGCIVEDDVFFYRYKMVDGEVYQYRKSEGYLLAQEDFLILPYEYKLIIKEDASE